ncbi:phage tail protein [Thalassospira mesophila]|uniref:phage tail protein n=1 Tax=Thalassospira mesophila TaxID=1293891 RepID=UPI000A1D604D|nr:tail fiber protein [Thalassospira mesophila]
MDETYMGVIWALGFQFVPRNWAYCSGALLPISQNQALFSLLGNIYGGDARVTYGLPDLRGRTAIGSLDGPGLPHIPQGQKVGAPYHALATEELPPHSHSHTYGGGGGGTGIDVMFEVAAQKGETQTPSAGDYLGSPGSALSLTDNLYVPANNVTSTIPLGGVTTTGSASGFNNNAFTIDDTGSGREFALYQPSQVINYCICVQGLYPARD